MAGTVAEIAFFVALVAVILIHEAAHFGVAKWFHIKVQEYFVGFGPRIWSFRRGETEYGVKAIPAGGYVRIAGMNPYEEISEEDLPRTFGAKPIWQRALVIAAGPATHFVLAFLCFALWLGFVGRPTPVDPVVASVSATLNGVASPAARVGVRPGDRIVGIAGITNPTDVQLIHITRTHVGEPVTLRVERDGRTMTVVVTPVMTTLAGREVGRIGVVLSEVRETSGPIGAISGGVRLVGDSVVGAVQGLARVFGPGGIHRIATLLFTDASRKPSDPVSIVGAGRVAGQTASSGRFWDILLIFATLNVFIGLLNLLPVPPFDGGHLAVLAIEKVFRKKVDARKLVPISAAVAAFFVLFFVAIMYLDLVKPLNLSP
jgi:membrane-associated protease RseP (regulator of RpoE activity)